MHGVTRTHASCVLFLCAVLLVIIATEHVKKLNTVRGASVVGYDPRHTVLGSTSRVHGTPTLPEYLLPHHP